MNINFQLESERLILRAYKADDLDEHIAILSKWDVTQWLSNNIPFPYNSEAGRTFIKDAIDSFTKGDQIYFSVIEKDTNRHIGGIKLFSAKRAECEIGYWLGPDFWGKSFASEFLDTVLAWLRREGKVKKLIAQTAHENAGSRKLLEKAGFLHNGSPPPEYSRCGHGAGCSEFYVLNFNERPDR